MEKAVEELIKKIREKYGYLSVKTYLKFRRDLIEEEFNTNCRLKDSAPDEDEFRNLDCECIKNKAEIDTINSIISRLEELGLYW